VKEKFDVKIGGYYFRKLSSTNMNLLDIFKKKKEVFVDDTDKNTVFEHTNTRL